MRKGWELKPLAVACEIKPPKSEARSKLSDSDLVSFLPMEDLGIDQKFARAVRTKPFGEVVGSYTYFAEGDVLLAKITPCFENGKLGIASQLKNGVGFGSSEYFVLRPDRSIERDWLYYFLSREVFREEGATRMSGAVGHKRVSKEFVEDYTIPVPPISEQRRIVGILDEAFASLATAKANAEKNLKNAGALFESHLNALFAHPCSAWVNSKLQTLTSKIGSGATPRGGGESYKTEGISLIRSLNVHDSEFRYAKLAFLDDEQAASLASVQVKSRDVLLNITGASIARCCIAPDTVLPARVNQHVSILRPIPEKLDAEFLHYLLISKIYKDRLLRTGEEGGSTRQAITKAQIQNFRITYPNNLKAQREIVTQLDSVSSETRRLESLYQQKLAALDALKKSLLHQAFSGAL